jgi:hypothetical protein
MLIFESVTQSENSARCKVGRLLAYGQNTGTFQHVARHPNLGLPPARVYSAFLRQTSSFRSRMPTLMTPRLPTLRLRAEKGEPVSAHGRHRITSHSQTIDALVGADGFRGQADLTTTHCREVRIGPASHETNEGNRNYRPDCLGLVLSRLSLQRAALQPDSAISNHDTPLTLPEWLWSQP